MLPNPSGRITPDTSPRGTKRSCSPLVYSNLPTGDLDDNVELRREKKVCQTQVTEAAVGNFKPRKRGRPSKPKTSIVGLDSPYQQSNTTSQNIPPTPQSQVEILSHQLPESTSTQASPPSATPTKALAIKALPTVRDHTTDQLGSEGDEYIPREFDEAGEKKVDVNGQLNGGREYKCRTFFVPNRGEKLFMLATECARVLGYRDSYLLFNKNRSLFKIIASQAEKEDLIRQDILPYSYRSRQIAIVSARSMFRQFGSRVIRNGRRVRDDYWESKARKQGFTEEDLAGEKRPGAAKARDVAGSAELSTTNPVLGPRHDMLYPNDPSNFTIDSQPHPLQAGMMGSPGSVPAHPLITLALGESDIRLKNYSNIRRPRQEINGSPYYDRIQPTSPADVISQAHQAAEYSKQINQQRCRNFDFLHRRWRQPRVLPSSSVSPRPIAPKPELLSTQPVHSLRVPQSGNQAPSSQQTTQLMVSSQPYPQTSHTQSNIVPSPMRTVNVGSIPSGQPGGPSGIFMGANNISGGSSYGYNQPSQTWISQAQQSPQSFHFSAKSPLNQRSPHQVPQLQHSGSASQMQQVLQYPSAQSFGRGYANLVPGLYTSDRGQQNYMQVNNTSDSQANSQIWTGQQSSASGNSWGWGGSAQ
ncbi:hypothetical protein K3495_g5223 [Podosphaera aphanis]|nr:hypothetical protein K3495_g5223 [Podosphaera aphanis]